MEKKSFNPSICSAVWIAACFLTMCLCGNSPEKKTHRFFSLDTVIDVTLYSNAKSAQKDLDSLERLVIALDAQLSISNPKSEIYRINHRIDSMQVVSGAIKDIIAACRREWKLSGGLFDVTVEPLKFLYGLESHQEKHHVPSPAEIAEALDRIGFGKINFVDDSAMILPKGLHIDLGGIAKGYILDKVCQFHRSKG